MNRSIKEKLNKFHIHRLSFLLIFSISISYLFYNQCYAESEEVQVIISPKTIKQGDTISVKISKSNEQSVIPKVFFDKTKVPVFQLSEKWYRTLIPVSANNDTKNYELTIFYNGKAKNIKLPISSTKYELQNLTLPKTVSELKASKIEKDLVAKVLNLTTNEKFWSGKFLLPSTARLSTPYGVKRRVNGVINPDYFHKGLDFAAKEGSNIKAPENGKIALVGLTSMGFVVNGNCIFIDHGHGVITGYLHLSSVNVKEGAFINKGQIIGKVGSTGIASGPHLHWGVYVLGMTVEPLNWINSTIE